MEFYITILTRIFKSTKTQKLMLQNIYGWHLTVIFLINSCKISLRKLSRDRRVMTSSSCWSGSPKRWLIWWRVLSSLRSSLHKWWKPTPDSQPPFDSWWVESWTSTWPLPPSRCPSSAKTRPISCWSLAIGKFRLMRDTLGDKSVVETDELGRHCQVHKMSLKRHQAFDFWD